MVIYYFEGFNPKYYNMEYKVPGAPRLAERIEVIVRELVAEEPKRGLVHGVWVPLMNISPKADIPVFLKFLSLPLTQLNYLSLFILGNATLST